ncbi:unnamed protein product [Aphanomyces euteiches]
MQSVWITLPVDIVIKIAFAVPDAAGLLAFLKVLRPYNVLGPLEHLFRLSLTHKVWDLWPCLRLAPSTLGSTEQSSYEFIAKYYVKVLVGPGWNDVEWLKAHLNPMAKVAWHIKDLPSTTEIADDWFDLQIPELRLSSMPNALLRWKDLLPRLQYLSSLAIYTDSNNLEDLFELVAKSKHIIDFNIVAPYHRMTASDVVYLTKWFQEQPVREFLWCLKDLGVMDSGVKQDFYEAMFNCPTLDRLELSGFELDDVNFTHLTFAMKSLCLQFCLESSQVVKSMSNRLESSNIANLELTAYYDDDLDGIECLLNTLPCTSIKHLKLSLMPIDNSPTWCCLALLFEKCTLETLTLEIDNLCSAFFQSLTTAIQNNHTICELDLSWSAIAVEDLKLLIESMTMPSRQVRTKRVSILSSSLQGMEPSTVENLTELAKERGGEFLY